MVRILIREGENLNIQTERERNTPMHVAARNGHYLIVKYLLENGAKPDITNNRGLTPKQYLDEVLISDPQKIAQIAKKQKSKAE